MREQDGFSRGSAAFPQRRERFRAQRVRVEHERNFPRRGGGDFQNQLARAGGNAHARSAQHDGDAREHSLRRGESRAAIQPAVGVFAARNPHRSRRARRERGLNAFRANHGNEPRSRAQRGERVQHQRAGHPAGTADDQRVPECALVAERRARRENFPQEIRRIRRGDGRFVETGKPDVRGDDASGGFGEIEQRPLQNARREREIRAERAAFRARVAQTRRQIDAAAGRVFRARRENFPQKRQRARRERRAEAVPENAVEQHVRRGDERGDLRRERRRAFGQKDDAAHVRGNGGEKFFEEHPRQRRESAGVFRGEENQQDAAFLLGKNPRRGAHGVAAVVPFSRENGETGKIRAGAFAQDARADGRSRRAHRRLLGHFRAGEKRFFERLRLRAAHHGNAGKSVFFRRGAGRGNFAHFKKIHSSGKIKPLLPRRQGGARPRSREKPRAGRNAPPHIQRLTRKKMKVTTAKSAMTPSVTK